MLIPQTDSPEHDFTDFYKLQELSTREKQFTSSHTKDWLHGVPNPYTICSYRPSESFNKTHFRRDQNTETNFSPEVVLSPVTSATTNRGSSVGDVPKVLQASKYAPEFKRNAGASAFSGLFQIPSYSYACPQKDGKVESVTQYCYQTQFEVGELTIIVGGVYVDPLNSLRRLGIPRATDISRISVHFPCDLPPHVNKEVLMSPVLAQNLDLILFNPTRGTVSGTRIETCMESYPGHLCLMKGTRVSDTHVFFSGGFEVKTVSVQHREDINRWIVRKKIVLNEDGYILDIRTMRFTKIAIKSKSELLVRGRIGNALVSNMFDRPTAPELKATLPVPFSMANSNFAPFGGIPVNPKEEKNATKGELTEQKGELTEQKEQKKQKDPHTLVLGIRPVTRIPTDLSSLRSLSSGSTVSRSLSKSNESKYSGSPVSPTTTPSSLKMSSVLLKSKGLFHRSSSIRHNQSPLQNTYSSQVKQHRTQPLQVSRSASPVKMKAPVKEAKSGSFDSESSERIASPQPRSVQLPPETLEKTLSREKTHRSEDNASTADSLDSTGYRALLLNNSALETGIFSVTVYSFGGFVMHEEDGRQFFTATNELLKLELIIEDVESCRFHPEALVFAVNPGPRRTWPSPRGYFALILIDSETRNEVCTVRFKPAEACADGDNLSNSEKSTSKSSSDRSYDTDQLLDQKSLLVQGGVNEDNTVFSEFYVFHFGTGNWQVVSTYAFDYYERPKQPFEDEDTAALSFDAQVDDPQLVEAELRSCHHHALLYREDDREYVFFLGGFSNDYLRHFDKERYYSEKFDISRLSRFLMASTNSNLLLVPVFNVQSQTWKFSRYFYDLSECVTSSAMEHLMGNEAVRNSRMSFHGGACSIVGKQITVSHGLVEFVPEKAIHFGKFKEELHTNAILLGAHSHLTFPSI